MRTTGWNLARGASSQSAAVSLRPNQEGEAVRSVDGAGDGGSVGVVAVDAEPLALFLDKDASGLAAAGDVLAVHVGGFGPVVSDPGDVTANGDFGLVHVRVQIFGVLEVVGVTADFVVFALVEIGVFLAEGCEIGVKKRSVAVDVGVLEGIPHGDECANDDLLIGR